jgi:hypothetical protein
MFFDKSVGLFPAVECDPSLMIHASLLASELNVKKNPILMTQRDNARGSILKLLFSVLA